MRVLLDTNVLISALITQGRSAEVLKLCLTKHTVITSRYILEELEEKLLKKFNYTQQEANSARLVLLEQVELITPRKPIERVCRDPDDDNILAAALEGECNCIVSGDKDLLVLKEYAGMLILKPAAFLEWEPHQR